MDFSALISDIISAVVGYFIDLLSSGILDFFHALLGIE